TSTVYFFFQAEDGIRGKLVTGVQTCALPIWELFSLGEARVGAAAPHVGPAAVREVDEREEFPQRPAFHRLADPGQVAVLEQLGEIGRASCRERVWVGGGAVSVERMGGDRRMR